MSPPIPKPEPYVITCEFDPMTFAVEATDSEGAIAEAKKVVASRWEAYAVFTVRKVDKP